MNKLKAMLMDKSRRDTWRRIVSICMAVIVFITTYALILPAITLEAKTYCGKEEHTHTEECYEYNDETDAHVHTDECYDTDGNLTCTESEDAEHVHTDECEKTLICDKEEHTHSEECYTDPNSADVQEAESTESADENASETEEANVPETVEFTYEETDTSFKVTIPYSSDLPNDLSLTIETISEDDESYSELLSSITTIDGDEVSFYNMLWYSNGELYDMPDDVDATLEITDTCTTNTYFAAYAINETSATEAADADAERAAEETVSAPAKARKVQTANNLSEETTESSSEETAATETTYTSEKYLADDNNVATITSAPALFAVLRSGGARSVSGEYYVRIDSYEDLAKYSVWYNSGNGLGTNSARIVIVSPNGNYLLSGDCIDMDTRAGVTGEPVEVRPVKGNDGYVTIVSVNHNNGESMTPTGTSGRNGKQYSLYHWIMYHTAGSDGKYNSSSSNIFLYNGNKTSSYLDINNQSYFKFEYLSDSKVWRIYTDNPRWTSSGNGYYLSVSNLTENSTASATFSHTYKTSVGGNSNMLIYAYVGSVPNAILDDVAKTKDLENLPTKETKKTYTYASDNSAGTQSGTLSSGVSYTASYDGTTYQLDKELGGDTTYAKQTEDEGRLITDKSVQYKNDDFSTGLTYSDTDFSVTLSALAQEFQNGESASYSNPVDVMLVLDLSKSMSDTSVGSYAKWRVAADTVEEAMKRIMKANSNNKVGLVAYSEKAVTLIPLGSYDANTDFLTYTAGQPYTLAVGNVSGVSNSGKTVSSLLTAYQNSYTQAGIEEAYRNFENVSGADTKFTYGVNGVTGTRQPVYILVTDGVPTVATHNYMNPSAGPFYGYSSGDTTTNGAYSYYTTLSAKYFKNMAGIKYDNMAAFYSIGIGVSDNSYEAVTLKPTVSNVTALSDASGTSEGDYRLLLLTTQQNDDPDKHGGGKYLKNVTVEGYSSSTLSVPNNWLRGVVDPYYQNSANENSTFEYCDDLFTVNSYSGSAAAGDVKTAIDALVKVASFKMNYDYLLGSGNIVFEDAIGDGFEVKDEPVLNLFGVNLKVGTNSGTSKVTYGGTQYNLTYDVTVTNSDNTYSYSGYITRPGTSAKTYTHGTNIEVLKIKLDGMTAEVDSTANKVTWTIPAAALPGLYPDLYDQFCYEEEPIRLIYKVGLTDASIEEAANSSEGTEKTYTLGTYDTESNTSGTKVTFTPAAGAKYYANNTAFSGINKTTNQTNTLSAAFTESKTNGVVTQYLGNNATITLSAPAPTIDVGEITKTWVRATDDTIDLPNELKLYLIKETTTGVSGFKRYASDNTTEYMNAASTDLSLEDMETALDWTDGVAATGLGTQHSLSDYVSACESAYKSNSGATDIEKVSGTGITNPITMTASGGTTETVGDTTVDTWTCDAKSAGWTKLAKTGTSETEEHTYRIVSGGYTYVPVMTPVYSYVVMENQYSSTDVGNIEYNALFKINGETEAVRTIDFYDTDNGYIRDSEAGITKQIGSDDSFFKEAIGELSYVYYYAAEISDSGDIAIKNTSTNLSTITKEWSDGNDKHTNDSVNVHLYRMSADGGSQMSLFSLDPVSTDSSTGVQYMGSHVLNADNDWTWNPELECTDENGNDWIYCVYEEPVDKYTAVYYKDSACTTECYSASFTYDNESVEGYEMGSAPNSSGKYFYYTKIKNSPSAYMLQLKKTWAVAENYEKPSSVTVDIYRTVSGTAYDSGTSAGSTYSNVDTSFHRTYTINAEDGSYFWFWKSLSEEDDLPAYDTDGNKYIYYIAERSVEGTTGTSYYAYKDGALTKFASVSDGTVSAQGDTFKIQVDSDYNPVDITFGSGAPVIDSSGTYVDIFAVNSVAFECDPSYIRISNTDGTETLDIDTVTKEWKDTADHGYDQVSVRIIRGETPTQLVGYYVYDGEYTYDDSYSDFLATDGYTTLGSVTPKSFVTSIPAGLTVTDLSAPGSAPIYYEMLSESITLNRHNNWTSDGFTGLNLNSGSVYYPLVYYSGGATLLDDAQSQVMVDTQNNKTYVPVYTLSYKYYITEETIDSTSVSSFYSYKPGYTFTTSNGAGGTSVTKLETIEMVSDGSAVKLASETDVSTVSTAMEWMGGSAYLAAEVAKNGYITITNRIGVELKKQWSDDTDKSSLEHDQVTVYIYVHKDYKNAVKLTSEDGLSFTEEAVPSDYSFNDPDWMLYDSVDISSGENWTDYVENLPPFVYTLDESREYIIIIPVEYYIVEESLSGYAATYTVDGEQVQATEGFKNGIYSWLKDGSVEIAQSEENTAQLFINENTHEPIYAYWTTAGELKYANAKGSVKASPSGTSLYHIESDNGTSYEFGSDLDSIKNDLDYAKLYKIYGTDTSKSGWWAEAMSQGNKYAAIADVVIKNSSGYVLPLTGGITEKPFILGGAALLLAAIPVYILTGSCGVRRRRKGGDG